MGTQGLFFLSLLYVARPSSAGGEGGACVCVCHRLRLFIGGEEQMTLQRFSFLARASFDCCVRLGTPRRKRDRFFEAAGVTSVRAIVEKGEEAPTSYLVVNMGSIPSVEREVLDLSKLKQTNSEGGPASAVCKEGIFLSFFRDFRERVAAEAAAEATARRRELGGHASCDGRGKTAALRAAAEVAPAVALETAGHAAAPGASPGPPDRPRPHGHGPTRAAPDGARNARRAGGDVIP